MSSLKSSDVQRADANQPEVPGLGLAERAWDWVAWMGIGAGIAAQIQHVLRTASPLDGDEAIVGLMAKHILEGRETPVFYYGQDYFGAVEAYLTVPFFALLGISETTLRLAPLLASLAAVLLIYQLGKQTCGRRPALLAAALTALPPLYYFDFQLRARGGFSLTHALVLLLALICLRWAHSRRRPLAPSLKTGPPATRGRLPGDDSAEAAEAVSEHSWSGWRVFGFGLLCGLLLYIYQAALFHVAAFFAAAMLLRKGPRLSALPAWTGGALLGMLPMLVYNWIHPLATVIQTAGHKYLAIGVPTIKEEGLIGALWVGFLNRLEIAGQGLGHLWTALAGRPPLESGWPEVLLAAPWATALAWAAWQRKGKWLALLRRRLRAGEVDAIDVAMLLLVVTFAAGYSGWHYLLFCYPLAALILAGTLSPERAAGDSEQVPHSTAAFRLSPKTGSWLSVAVLTMALALNAYGLARGMPGQEAPRDWHQLIDDLDALDLNRGYAGYWTAYPVNFLSHERILLSPLAGPVWQDRYPAYTQRVRQAEQVVYIVQTGSRAEQGFLRQLARLQAQPQSRPSGPYTLYYGLPQDVRTQVRMPFASNR